MFKFSIIALMSVSVLAFAGKREREEMEKTTAPAVKKAEATFKESCGCSLAITVDEVSLASVQDLSHARYIADSISENAPKYCTDGPSKKSMCRLQTLTLAKGKPAAFTFKDGHGIATTDGTQSTTWQMITKVLDK
jgi:hypothetical protein